MTEQEFEMAGKVCLVTGATSGIGEATALELAKRRAVVVLVGRKKEKCSQTVERIKQQTGNPAVDYLVADLSAQKEIRRVAAEFKTRQARLDVLVNNVGAVFLTRHKTADGIEMTFGLNHLSPFLLTNLLLDVLKASAPARIINITSAILNRARLNLEDLEYRKVYDGNRAYEQSKLCNLLFTYELARRLTGQGVMVNALHPGFAATNLGKNNAGILRPFVGRINIGGISPLQAAQYVVRLSSDPELENITSAYFINDQISSSIASYDQEAGSLLWEISAQKTGLGEEQI